MRTLVLATAVNDGFISLDPDKVSLSMLPLDKKFYSGPDLTDDLFAGSGAGTFDDVWLDDDFFFSPPTSTVTVTVGLSGIACSDYGDDEESVLVAAMVTTLSDAVSVDSSAFSDTTCSDSRRRRGLLQTSSVSIDMPFSVSSDGVDDYAYNTLESTVSDTVSAAQSSGALDSTIADEASARVSPRRSLRFRPRQCMPPPCKRTTTQAATSSIGTTTRTRAAPATTTSATTITAAGRARHRRAVRINSGLTGVCTSSPAFVVLRYYDYGGYYCASSARPEPFAPRSALA